MRPGVPGQSYNTGQGFGPPPMPGNGRGPAGAYPAGQGYPPAPDYRIGQGFGPPPGQGNGRGYRPADGSGGGQGAPARRSGPRQGHNGGPGYAPAPQSRPAPAPPGGADSGRGYPPPQGPHAARRLYAVPDSSAPGPEAMGRNGAQTAQFGGGQAQFGSGQMAVALADPAWRGDPQDGGPFHGSQMPAMSGSQAAAITQAWSQATAIREAAEKDAAAIRQEAVAVRQEAVAVRQAAEREAAEMRAAILSMSEQLNRMAAYVAETFPSGGTATAVAERAPAALAAPPAVLPAQRPAAPGTRPRPGAPATRPGRPATRPGRPETRPGRPDAKPGRSTTRPGTSQGRQARAARKVLALLAVMATAGVITGTAQLVLHGGRFFIFRENGAGASETGRTDGQFPGHPGAPAPPKHAK